MKVEQSQSKIGVMYISGKKENVLSKTQKVGCRTGRKGIRPVNYVPTFPQIKIKEVNDFPYMILYNFQKVKDYPNLESQRFSDVNT